MKTRRVNENEQQPALPSPASDEPVRRQRDQRLRLEMLEPRIAPIARVNR